MIKTTALLIFLIVLNYSLSTDPDISKTTPQLISGQGYTSEEHYTTTKDGFVLSLHRIPNGKGNKNNKSETKPVAFLQHGLLDSSSTWVVNNAEQSLGFILADAGFDVWMGNNRGNTYSNKNVNLKPDQAAFWAWTWDQFASDDVPTMIDYVLNSTGQSKLIWIGHSRGTQQMFAALSVNPKLADKLSLFVALAPIAYLGNIQSFLMKFLSTFDRLDILDFLGFHDFLPPGTVISKYLPQLCLIFPTSCDDLGYLLFGCCDSANFNQSRLDVYWGHVPAGTSSQEMAHYAQAVYYANEQMYDYGSARANRQHYGQDTPPAYNLTSIPSSLPIALFSGGLDILSNPKDVTFLKSLLKNVVLWNIQPRYTHMDYTWGMNAYKDIYPLVVDIMRKV